MAWASAQALAAAEANSTSASRAVRWAVLHNPWSLCGVLRTALVRNLRGYLFREPTILWDADQVAILHDLFGNPFRPRPPIALHVLQWNEGIIRRLAEVVYENRIMPTR
jgi:hypothetical protein